MSQVSQIIKNKNYHLFTHLLGFCGQKLGQTKC